MAAGELWLILTWLFCAMVLIGLGAIGQRLLLAPPRLTDAFWIGLGLSIIFLQIWHLFAPIGPAASTTLAVIGLRAPIANGRSFLPQIRKNIPFLVWPTLLILAVIWSAASRSSGPWPLYDTGLYGAETLKWTKAYPVVAGLANLEDRFGFNASSFLCFAALDVGAWSNASHHIFVGMIVVAFSVGPAVAICRILKEGTAAAPNQWFYAVLIIPTIFWTCRHLLVGTDTDLPPTAVCLVAAAIVNDAIWAILRKPPEESAEAVARLPVAALLCAVIVTLKLSMAFFAGLLWLVAIGILIGHRIQVGRLGWRIAAVVVLSVVTIVPWMIHGAILSGWPLYPETVFPLSRDWRVPTETAHTTAMWVKSYAKEPLPDPSLVKFPHWMLYWTNHHKLDFESLILPAAFLIAGPVLSRLTKRARLPRPVFRSLVLFTALAGIAFWFCTAPDPRFAQAVIWGAAALSMGGFLIGFPYPRAAIALFFLLGFLLIKPWSLAREEYKAHDTDSVFDPMPRGITRTFQTRSGLILNIPVTGDQTWDAPMPATGYPRPEIRLRNPANMGDGFSIQPPRH